MKYFGKLFLFVSMFLFLTSVADAQEIGVRLGNISAGNVAVDGVFNLNSIGRIHADLSFGHGSVGLDGIWDFMYKPLNGEAFNWYAGVGATTVFGDFFTLGAVGELGLEYRFKFPISLSLDWRPTFIIIDYTDFVLDNFGLNVRYVF